ncbi:TonB-dependent receptor plug domain-containing protein [Idiomarina sp. HP20-50]|uniref:TonB-dependent receptor plug domain-containing protein n=1 Tax=Idiomarina sp. HP20-50 TaxID=3070813 RepID=UPI00294B0A5D|nr:TonB-dependent receptor plug domain-containing protein [Idiomarina sp. HP20-50]MDV6316176.1 TonB-dependent receptor plug domain-containing protein [Idiomarina sp. HP20-50]
MNYQHKIKPVALAVSLGLFCSSATVYAQQQSEQDAADRESPIEEVVTTGTRLQGTAAAVVQERKEQAFVADIIGAAQLSRTGDSDAAAALRRVTGLTLVDGKFIYVRGLGERYSSARINGANIPSPDLTRNVVPLDIIPSTIIESMAVQKVFSPSMPAAFGGGNIDIRTKSIPNEFLFSLEAGVGLNENARDGYTYNRNEAAVPADIQAAIGRYKGDFSVRNIANTDGISGEQARLKNLELGKQLPRNMSLQEESLSPNFDFKASIGNRFDESWLGGSFGFLAAVSYDNEWDVSKRRSAVLSENASENCSTELKTTEDVSNSCYNTVSDTTQTVETERKNGFLTLGYELDTHSISYNKIYLQDSEDESEFGILQSPNGSNLKTIAGTGLANREHEFKYEERTLDVDQLRGKHTFMDYWMLGFDWQYTESKAETNIPTEVSYRFDDVYDNQQNYIGTRVTGDDNRAVFSYVDMVDHVKSYGGNFSLPFSLDSTDIELKAGYDFTDKARYYSTSRFVLNNQSGITQFVEDDFDEILGVTDYITDSFIDANNFQIGFNEPTPPDADDYIAAQIIDAYYGEFDVFFDEVWRFSGGLRYEDFKQVSLATSSLIFSETDLNNFFNPERVAESAIAEDDTFLALSMTYLPSDNYQFRLGYGETVVRPDLRETVPVVFFDPITDIRTIGRAGLQSSPLKNYDARFEYYADNGDNYSLAAFYKDIERPIESVLSVGDEEYTLSYVNGESAEVYGVEFEWLHDLGYVSNGFFTSGNLTLSDSEAVIDPALAGNLTNTTKRMTGHSKYVANVQLNYDSSNGEHSTSLVYNVFGERILAAGIGGRGDAYEQPFHSLDLVYNYYPDFNSKVSFKIKNMLDEDQEVLQSDVLVRSKEVGRVFSISYKYEF